MWRFQPVQRELRATCCRYPGQKDRLPETAAETLVDGRKQISQLRFLRVPSTPVCRGPYSQIMTDLASEIALNAQMLEQRLELGDKVDHTPGGLEHFAYFKRYDQR